MLVLVAMFSSGDKPRLRLDPELQIPGELGKSHKLDVSSTSYILGLSSCTARDVCRLMTPDITLFTLQVLLDKIKSTAMFGNHLKFGDCSVVTFEITLVRIAQATKPMICIIVVRIFPQ